MGRWGVGVETVGRRQAGGVGRGDKATGEHAMNIY
jgi:hypothetical protein